MNENFNKYVQAFLATAITVGFFGVIAALLMIKEVPPGVKDILLVLLGALLASWKEVTGYFFGSSSGSAKKDEQNAALTAQITSAPVTAPVTPVTQTDPKETTS